MGLEPYRHMASYTETSMACSESRITRFPRTVRMVGAPVVALLVAGSFFMAILLPATVPTVRLAR